jgi:hypothetical protein
MIHIMSPSFITTSSMVASVCYGSAGPSGMTDIRAEATIGPATTGAPITIVVLIRISLEATALQTSLMISAVIIRTDIHL